MWWRRFCAAFGCVFVRIYSFRCGILMLFVAFPTNEILNFFFFFETRTPRAIDDYSNKIGLKYTRECTVNISAIAQTHIWHYASEHIVSNDVVVVICAVCVNVANIVVELCMPLMPWCTQCMLCVFLCECVFAAMYVVEVVGSSLVGSISPLMSMLNAMRHVEGTGIVTNDDDEKTSLTLKCTRFDEATYEWTCVVHANMQQQQQQQLNSEAKHARTKKNTNI